MNSVIEEGTFIIKDNFYKGIYNNLYTKGKKITGKLWQFNEDTFFCRAKLLSNCEHDVEVIYKNSLTESNKRK